MTSKRIAATRPTTPRASGRIRSLATGVPGFDAILGGGLPEFSFNLIAGSPGSGKTTLAQQLIFANATPERPALYFTVLGEPTIKMLRYQQEFGFFDLAKVGTAIEYVNLSEEALAMDLRPVLDRIIKEVERAKPAIVVVDSFRTLASRSPEAGTDAGLSIDQFVQHLALHLTSWEVTSFLLGEYGENEQRNPVFTVADGVIWLSQVIDRNSVVRKLQAIKVRGRAPMPGLHTFRITDDGIQLFPRIPEQQSDRRSPAAGRLTTGVPGLDELMGGGIPCGDAVMLAGPAGSGKTTFATQFAAEGLRQGESVVIVVFEEYPEEYLARASARNHDMEQAIEEGRLELIYLRPLDLSVDETLAEILQSVQQIDATRVVIDSLSGFEIALAPAFRDDFRESLYRLVGALTATGVTILMTTETVREGSMGFTTERVSFITDDIIVQRFVEIDGVLRTVLAIHKMRGSEHSHDFRLYEIGANGAIVGGPLRNYSGITTGLPQRQIPLHAEGYPGLTGSEAAVLDALIRLREGSVEALAGKLSMQPGELALTLARFETLGYAEMTSRTGPTYRAVAQTSG